MLSTKIHTHSQTSNKLASFFIAILLLVTILSCEQKNNSKTTNSTEKKTINTETPRRMPNKEYNLIFISIDTLRADHLGCYGYKRNTSPGIDAFAKKNIIFKNFFTVVPKTGPSMTSFFTGQYIQQHGIAMNMSLRPPTMKTMVHLLPKNFTKVAFVANPALNKLRGHANGFDDFTLIGPKNEIEKWSQKDLTPSAISWLQKNKGNGFFLWLHYLDPHGPYKPPPEFHEMFVNDAQYNEKITVPLDYEIPNDPAKTNLVLGAVPQYQRLGNNNIVDYYIAQYDAEIRYTDTEIKKLLNYLQESELMKNTIVVITSDHGESLGEHNYFFEHGMFVNEGSIKIPLIMSHPDIHKPIEINALVQSIDIAPTLLAEYGLEFPNRIEGKDISNLYRVPKDQYEPNPYIYSCTPYIYDDFYETTRTHTDKLIRQNEKYFQYYDLTSDPDERINLYSKNPNKLKRRKELFSTFGKDTTNQGISETDRHLPTKTLKGLKSLGYTR